MTRISVHLKFAKFSTFLTLLWAMILPPTLHAQQTTVAKNYEAKWISLPNIAGSLPNGEADLIKHKKGDINVIFFLATWCIPCQKFTPKLIEIENSYKSLGVNVLYVFNHDLMADVNGYIKSYKLKNSTSILATNKTLLAYRDPTLPAIYIADKKGWIIKRLLGTKQSLLKKEDITKTLDYLILQ
jgi:thiol-disulfide isomerase/thioredoxin